MKLVWLRSQVAIFALLALALVASRRKALCLLRIGQKPNRVIGHCFKS
jgi:hypothetical protein